MLDIDRGMVLKAIEDSQGSISIVAKRLGCSWPTARNYIKKWDSTASALNEEREGTLDIAENRLVKAVDDGEPWAVKFILLTQGKHRGYTYELDHAVNVTVNLDFGDSRLKDV